MRIFSAREDLPKEGFAIATRATFTGFKGIPWLVLSHNSANPRFVLFSEQMECKVLKTKRYPYAAIEKIDARTTMGTHNLIFEFHASWFSFIANLPSKEDFIQLLRQFDHWAIPFSPRALHILSSHSTKMVPPPTYVEQAGGDTVVICTSDETIIPWLVEQGFHLAPPRTSSGTQQTVLSLKLQASSSSDDWVQKAKWFDILRQKGICFSFGREWNPADLFRLFRDKGLLSGSFREIAWTRPGEWRIWENQ